MTNPAHETTREFTDPALREAHDLAHDPYPERAEHERGREG